MEAKPRDQRLLPTVQIFLPKPGQLTIPSFHVEDRLDHYFLGKTLTPSSRQHLCEEPMCATLTTGFYIRLSPCIVPHAPNYA